LDPFQNRKVLDTALRTKFNTVDGEKIHRFGRASY